ncbi:MAG: uroporphyrinogen-III C-methyltransferase, partial [Anaerolineae bacterium]
DGDLAGAWLVIAATDDPVVNHAVSVEAERHGCLVNVVDAPQHSNFIVPAVVRRGEVTVTVSTGGASPALARRLRERLAQIIGPEYGDLAALMAELRPELLARFPPGRPRLEAALHLVDSDLLAVLKDRDMAAARAYAEALLEASKSGIEASAGHPHDPEKPTEAWNPEETPLRNDDFSRPPGIVYLIGAGPGDPGLITVRGLECLRSADVVVYDRLIPLALLAEAPAAQWLDVGKRPGNHPVPQEQINALLIEHARQGKRVARLKGGDPFVFGRGGEEAEALATAGVPFEIVPGVTSAIAAAAYAGIPVTHRNVACSFVVLTGHRREGADEPGCDWQRAVGADTVVFLMGVGNLPTIVENLIAAGRSPETAAAVVAQGTCARQRTVTGTLRDIVGVVAAAGIRPPAALIVGDVVKLRERLRWFDRPERRPLLGLRVLNTRPAHESAELTARLSAAGAEVIPLPVIRIAAPDDPAPLDMALHRLASATAGAPAYHWIVFTSANAVDAFMARLLASDGTCGSRPGYDLRILAGARLAAVGPATVAALRRYGLVADLRPERASGRDLATSLLDVAGQRVLLPRSDQALPDLPQALAARGAYVTEVIAYTVKPAAPNPAALAALDAGEVDVAAFFSPSALEGLAAMLDRPLAEALQGVAVACIGPTTAAAARALGLAVAVMPEEPSVSSLIAALMAWRKRFDGSPER